MLSIVTGLLHDTIEDTDATATRSPACSATISPAWSMA